jgi:hypothetical protein
VIEARRSWCHWELFEVSCGERFEKQVKEQKSLKNCWAGHFNDDSDLSDISRLGKDLPFQYIFCKGSAISRILSLISRLANVVFVDKGMSFSKEVSFNEHLRKFRE